MDLMRFYEKRDHMWVSTSWMGRPTGRRKMLRAKLFDIFVESKSARLATSCAVAANILNPSTEGSPSAQPSPTSQPTTPNSVIRNVPNIRAVSNVRNSNNSCTQFPKFVRSPQRKRSNLHDDTINAGLVRRYAQRSDPLLRPGRGCPSGSLRQGWHRQSSRLRRLHQ